MDFPDEVKSGVGYALYLAQKGELAVCSKILKGFSGAGVIEIIDHDKSGTFRVVYTIKISNFVCVLHAFQKKSKQGIKTPKQEFDLIKKRLQDAQELCKELTREKRI